METRVTVNGKPVVADIIDLKEGPDGWVDIEDLSPLHTAATKDVTKEEFLATDVEDPEFPVIKLPTKRLHGNVVVKVSTPETE